MIAGPPARRFTVSDAMALVAALAVGLALDRAPYRSVVNQQSFIQYEASWARRASFRMGWSLGLLRPPLTALTVALLAVRLRPPRPRRASLLLRPGTIALVAATTAALLFWVARVPWICVAWDVKENVSDVYNAWLEMGRIVEAAVPAAWASLALAGRWRPEPSWIDRAGRCVGVVWSFGLPWTLVANCLHVFAG
jgi:hypothetical protein